MCSMNVRINVTIPAETVKKLKSLAPKRRLSRFLAEAADEKLKRIEREKALKELLEAPPTFTDIKDSVKWVRKMRHLDEKRMRRLGI